MKKNLPNFISFPPKEEETENYNINLLEKNVYFDENIYFIHYLSNSRKMDFNDPINKKEEIPYIMSQEFSYSYFEVFKDIKPAIKETIPQIMGRIKQFQNSKNEKFNIAFLDNIQAYAEILGLKQTQDYLLPVLTRVVDEKIEIKIHFLEVLYQGFVDYLCSIGDEGVYLLREKIIQIIQDLYREKNITNNNYKNLLFKVFIKIAKSIIPREKDKKDNYIIDLVISFGYESNVTKEFFLEHKKLCIKFIAKLAEDFGQDWCENYLLPQLWFFGNEEEEEIKKQVLTALPFICCEIRYEMIGTKVYNLIKKIAGDKSTDIRKNSIPCLANIINVYQDKAKKSKELEKKKEKEDPNEIKIDPGSVKNFLAIIEKFILDNQKCVRDKIIEHIGEIISPLEKDELSQKLLNFYIQSADEFYYNKEIVPIKSSKKNAKKKEESEEPKNENINYWFAYNFPAVLFCYGIEIWPKLGPIFKSMCKEKDMKVRRSIISSFHEIAKIVGEQITENELLSLYDNFLNSKNAGEKKFAIKNLPKILSNVSKEVKEKYFKYFDAVSIFQKNINNKAGNLFFTNWKNKVDVIEGILYYYHLYDKDVIYNSILPQCVNFCFDDVYKVRSISCKVLANLILYLYHEDFKKNELYELLELFGLHKKYYQRICFVKMCKVLLKSLNLYNEKVKYLLYILVNNEKSEGVNAALGKSLSKVYKKKKFKTLKEISLHRICLILLKNKSISIQNMFNGIQLECNAKDEEIFDFKEIDKLIQNKVKIFDKDNSFIKKEFNFDISECQHKYPNRLALKKKENENNKKSELNENIINTNNNEDKQDIKIENKTLEEQEKKEEKEEIEKKQERNININLNDILKEENKNEVNEIKIEGEEKKENINQDDNLKKEEVEKEIEEKGKENTEEEK